MKKISAAAFLAAMWVVSGPALAENPWSDANYHYYPGDFNGDGEIDVLYIAKAANRSSGIVLAKAQSLNIQPQTWPSTFLGIPWSGSTYRAVVADYNGDGRDDIFLQRATAGDSFLLLTDEQGKIQGIHQSVASVYLGLGWTADQHTLIPGDFNGDTKADLLLQARTPAGSAALVLADANGQFVVGPHQTWGNQFLDLQWSAAQANLFAGDFNGDFRDDLLIQARPDGNGNFGIEKNGVLLSQATPPIFDLAGLETWDQNAHGVDWSPAANEIVVGDFNKDGRTDVLLKAKAAGNPSHILYGSETGSTFVVAAEALESNSPYPNTPARTLANAARTGGQIASSALSSGSGGGMAAMAVVAPSAIGRTPGAFSVSNYGSAVYTIPIVVPPGVRGIQPDLSISYDSSRENGLLGVGWGLTGFPQIERCRNTWAQDGNSSGVLLQTGNAGDRYCLNGMKFRLVSGTYGANGATYQPELNDYSKITSYNTAGAGPEYFTVHTKDGKIYEYGATADSRIEVTGSSSVRVWALNKVSDRTGNSMAITYTDDTVNGSFRPNEIQYTANAGAGLAAKYKVNFYYESRTASDTLAYYFAGGVSRETNRLDRIEAKYNNVLVKKYEIDYDNSGAGGRSRLTAVQECDKDNLCLPATTVSWQSGTAGVGSQQSSGLSGIVGGSQYTIDVNGDGREDIVFCGSTTWQFVLSNGTAYGSPIDTGVSHANACVVAIPTDYNSDGKQDLLIKNGSGAWQVLQSNGSSFSSISTGIPATGTTPGSGGAWAADINGDGREDLVYVPTSLDLRARLNSASGYQAETVIHTPSEPYSPTVFDFGYRNSSIASDADFNGDGRADFILVQDYQRTHEDPVTGEFWIEFYHRAVAHVSNTTGGYVESLLETGTISLPQARKWKILDLNGDGYSDLAYPKLGAPTIWNVRFGSGLGLTAAVSTGIVTDELKKYVIPIDWDKDGKDDLLEYYPTSGSAGSWHLLRSTGESLSYVGDTSISNGVSDFATVADIDGDSLLDLMSESSGTWSYRRHQGIHPDLVTSIVDGYGNSTGIQYGALTDAAVYTKGSGATFPAQDIQTSRHVVKRAQVSNGIGGTYNNDYTYQSERVDLSGRGSLGFGAYSVSDSRNNAAKTVAFRQDFPYVGVPSSVALKQQNGNFVSQTLNVWSSHSSGSTWQQSEFVYLNVVTQTDYEVSATIPGIDGAPVVEKKTTTTIGSGNYGTPSTVVVETRDVTSAPTLVRTLTTSNSFATHDTGNWCVGFVNNQTVTSAIPGPPSTTRTTQLVKDAAADKCRVQQEVTEPSSAYTVTTSFGFDSFGNINSTTVSATGITNRVTSANYGSDGVFPETITNAEGHVTDPSWNYALGVPTGVLDPNLLTTTWQYDGFGRRTGEIRPDGTSTTWTISGCSAGNSYCGTSDGTLALQVQERFLNTSSGVVRTDYGLFDRFERQKYSQSQLISGSTSTVATQFDSFGRIAQQSRPFIWGGSVYYTTFSYDLRNRPTKEERQISATNGSLQSIVYSYNKLTRTQTDAESKVTTRYLNALGQIVQVTDAASGNSSYTYDPLGNLLTAKDPLNNTITNTYNVRGFKETSADPDMGSWAYQYYRTGELYTQTDAKAQVTTFAYDRLGRPVSRTEPEGTTNWNWGNASGNYNIGELESVTSPGSYAEAYAYDNKSRMQQVSVTADGATYLTNYTYTADTGQLDTVTYPEVFYRDGLGAVTKARDWNAVLTGSPAGSLTVGVGANRMLVVAVSWENGSAPAANISVGGQSPTQKVVSVSTGTSSQVGHDIYIFNQAKIAAMSGTAIAVTAGTYPATTKWSYATLAGVNQTTPVTTPGFKAGTTGTTLVVDNPAPQAAAYSIVLVSNDQNVNNLHILPVGYLEKYDTDAAGAFSTALGDRSNTAAGAVSVVEASSGDRWLASQLGFNAAPGAVTTGGRFKVDYDYAYGLMQAVKDFVWPSTVYWQQTATNAAGQVTAEQFGNGLTTSSAYDAVTGLLGSRTTGATNNVQNLTYQWDKSGNLKQRRDVSLNLTEDFFYDDLYRLDYSQLNSVNNMDLAYNAAGAITSKTGVGTYTYSTQGVTSARPHTPTATSTGSVTYAYDNNGNRTGRTVGGVTSATTWYSYNLPKEVNKTTSGPVISAVEFYYGAFRNRYKQVSITAASQPGQVMPVGIETTVSINGIFEKIIKPSPSGALEFKHSIAANGQIVAIRTLRNMAAHDTIYLQKDHLGSVDAITNETGGIVQKLSYDAFGQRRNAATWSGAPAAGDWTSIANTTHRGYTEHEGLDNVDLVHMNGRVYDPVIAQFTSADPVVQDPLNGQNLNRFSYVLNNPLTRTDPSGYRYTDTFEDEQRTLNLANQDAEMWVLVTAPGLQDSTFTVHSVYAGGSLLFDSASMGGGLVAAGGEVTEDMGSGVSSGGNPSDVSRGIPIPEGIVVSRQKGGAPLSSSWINILTEGLGWGLVAFDIANSFISPTPDVGIVGAGIIGSARAAKGVKPLADITKKIKQFEGKSLRDQKSVYESLTKTYEKHLQKYGQTAGNTSGETNRMERELAVMREILERRGVQF